MADKLHTVTSLGILRQGPTAIQTKGPFISALEAPPQPYERKSFLFFPFRKQLFRPLTEGKIEIDEKGYELAKRELYGHAYQAVCSLILAIMNVDNVRKIREATTELEQGLWRYQIAYRHEREVYRKASLTPPSPNRKFEELVKEAGEIRDQSDLLIDQLAQNADRFDLCEKIDELCTKFRHILSEVNIVGRAHIKSEKLKRLRPKFFFNMERLFINDIHQILDYLSGKSRFLGGESSDILKMTLIAQVADVSIRLEPEFRNATAFKFLIPSEVPPEIDPVGLYIECETIGRGTYFAGLFEAMERSLKTRFQHQEIPGKASVIFFPKTNDRALGTERNLLA